MRASLKLKNTYLVLANFIRTLVSIALKNLWGYTI